MGVIQYSFYKYVAPSEFFTINETLYLTRYQMEFISVIQVSPIGVEFFGNCGMILVSHAHTKVYHMTGFQLKLGHLSLMIRFQVLTN